MIPILACGAVALAFIAGDLLIRGSWKLGTTRFTLDRVAMRIAIGMAMLTPVFVLLAQAHLFNPPAIGSIGWIMLAAWAYARRGTRWQWRAAAPDAIIALGVVVFVTVAVIGRDEPWGMGRDQQVYAEFAVLLARTGSASIKVEAQDAADADLLRSIGADREVNRFLGIARAVNDASIEQSSYLPLGWPAWLAIAFTVGKFPALHSANALVFALGALLLFPVLRRRAGTALATASVITLLALPSSLWIAGISLSEPFAMVIWLATMGIYASPTDHARRWVPAMVFAASTVRIDASVLIPALMAAQFADASLARSEPAIHAARCFASRMMLSLVAVLAWQALVHRPYLAYNVDQIVPVAVATLIVGCVAAGNARWYATAGRALSSKMAGYLIAIAIVGLALYAMYVRPDLEPFATIHNGTGLDGTRDYREDSLRNLAAYVGWPLLALAVAGASIAAVRSLRPATTLAERAFVVTGIAFCALYLWAPLVSPDHPWAIRRLVPVVIPVVVSFAAIALRTVLRKRGPFTMAAGFIMVGAACEVSARSGLSIITTRENQGAAALIDAVNARLPDALVVSDLAAANMAAVLSVAGRRDVVVADFGSPDARVAIARWLEAKTREGKPAWLLSGDRLSPSGARSRVVADWQLERRAVARTTRPPAREVVHESVQLKLSRVDALDSDIAFEGFGGTPVWGIADEGFFPAETTPFGTLRMTNGSAMLEVPSLLLRDATVLEFDWFSWAPWGETRATTVRIDGALAWRGMLPPGVSKSTVPLRQPLPSDAVRIGIESAAFDPRVLDPADFRARVGVGLRAIRARAGGLAKGPVAPSSQAPHAAGAR